MHSASPELLTVHLRIENVRFISERHLSPQPRSAPWARHSSLESALPDARLRSNLTHSISSLLYSATRYASPCNSAESHTFSTGTLISSSIVLSLCLSVPRIPFQSSVTDSTFSTVLSMHCLMISKSTPATAYFGIM